MNLSHIVTLLRVKMKKKRGFFSGHIRIRARYRDIAIGLEELKLCLFRWPDPVNFDPDP